MNCVVVDRDILQVILGTFPDAREGRQFVAGIVSLFEESGRQAVADLRGAAEKADPTQIRLVAHKLKGLGANVGAQRLGEMCRQVEQAAREGHCDTEKVEAVGQEFADAMDQLRELFPLPG